MEKPVQVVILGTSVILAGVAHALRTQAGLSVRVAGGIDELPRLLAQSHPDILIFDLATFTPDAVRRFVCWHDAPTLIGVDIASRQAFTFASCSCPLRTLDDLTRLIDQVSVAAISPAWCAAP